MARDVRIVVIGKDTLLREALLALLRAEKEMEVLTPLDCEAEAIRSLVLTPTPDVVVIHFSVVTAGGLAAVSAVRRRWPTAHVLALLGRLDDRTLGAATEAGIDGCICESDSHTELLSAIHTVAKGERYFTRSGVQPGGSGQDKLTEREKEITRLIAAGYRTREIAVRLSLSGKTIEKHRASIMRKLGVRSAAAVAAYAIAHGHLIL